LISPESFTEQLSKSEKIVNSQLKAYLKEPNEEHVHDLRTSIRRLLATADVLPKKIRKTKNSKKNLANYEELLKLNTGVRDTDIVLSKLPSHGDDPAYSKLAKQLTRERESNLNRAKRVASSIEGTDLVTFNPKDISPSDLQKRFKKTTSSLTKKLKKGLRLVKDDPKDLNQLHKLREDSRRLRYTLEIDDNPDTTKLSTTVGAWQDILGKIRDSDIFISHLNKAKTTPKISEVLDQEKASRKENFSKFLEISKESPALLH
jgi:CHAD domain-containing protein